MALAGMGISLVGGLIALALGQYGVLALAVIGFFVCTMIVGQSSPSSSTSSVSSRPGESKVDTYFTLIESINAAKKAGKTEQMLAHCKRSIELLPAVIRSTKREFKTFDISSIPAITQACIFWAVLGRADEIRTAHIFCKQYSDLKDWDEEFEQAYKRLNLASRIEGILRTNSMGYPQNKLKAELGELDGRFLSNTIHYMEAAGKVKRQQNGKTYTLFPA